MRGDITFQEEKLELLLKIFRESVNIVVYRKEMHDLTGIIFFSFVDLHTPSQCTFGGYTQVNT